MAVVVQLAEPVTSDVPSVSPFLKPVMVASSAGLAIPYCRVMSFAVTLRLAGVTVRLVAPELVA